MRWPILSGSPVLDSLRPAIENSREVRTNIGKIVEVAGWMGYEELPLPEFTLPFGVGADDANEAIDFILVADSIDTAFTDFSTHEKFQVDFAGQHWSDSEAEFACLKRALDAGKPILDGKYLAKISRTELDDIFAGNMKMPMLDEKLAVLHQIGAVLADKYNGRFHNFQRLLVWCFRLSSETVKKPGWRGQCPHLLSLERQTSIESPHPHRKRR